MTLGNVLDDVNKQWHRFLVLPAHGDTSLTLWAAATHLSRDSEFFPRLAITAANWNAGKSKALAVLRRLCHDGKSFAGITGAGLFRLMDATLKAGSTFLLDEADNLPFEDSAVLRAVLNAGIEEDGATIIRCTGEDYTPTEFDVRGWVGLAQIGQVEPAPLRSRCIIVHMVRALTPPPELFGHIEKAEVSVVAARLHEAVSQVKQEILFKRPDMPPQLKNRSADKWRRLIALADIAGGEWPARARAAALATVEDENEPDTWTSNALMLDALEAAIAGRTESVTLEDIKAYAYAAGMGQDELEPSQKLGQRLAGIGLHSIRARVGRDRIRKYTRADMLAALEKHGRHPQVD